MVRWSSVPLEAWEDRYAVEFAPRAAIALGGMPAVAARVRRQLNEIAEVASTLATPAADRIGAMLRLEVDGFVVHYTVSDSRRVVDVRDVVPPLARP